MNIKIPELSLVILIGASGSGKSTFAQKHFKRTEILSSDFFRGMVSDDENNQSASGAAFEVLYFVAAKRLAAGKLTVIDATNVQKEGREKLLKLAREYHCLPVAIVFHLPEKVCHAHNQTRTDRNLPAHVIRRQTQQLRRSLKGLKREGFRYIYKFSSVEELQAVQIKRERLWTDKKEETGPFDIIGDIHGCFDELKELLGKLGYQMTGDGCQAHHPEGRKAIFLGDLVDRGPDTPAVLRLVMNMVRAGNAYCVPGNHDMKLLRKLNGHNVQVRHGLEMTLQQMEHEPPEWIEEVRQFLDGLVSHYVLDRGKLVVAHAGLKESLQGRASGRVREFALYGETTGEVDEYGLPVRYHWSEEYRGRAMVVYGHTPVREPVWINGTLNIDTGCVFGGKLTALRYPEKEVVSVPAKQVYVEPARPLIAEENFSTSQDADLVLDIQDILEQRISTRLLQKPVKIEQENAMAALEAMSRFVVDPKWLIYLPPTMSPTETSQEPGLLEHPREAFAYYREQGVPRVICEEKHMGSRAIVVVCRDAEVARKRFGIEDGGWGICYTRTGRRFFHDQNMEQVLLQRLRLAMDKAGFWEKFETGWACFDCELMPWSAKAQELLQQQYAAVGFAATRALSETVSLLERAKANGREVGQLYTRYLQRQEQSMRFVDAYRRYCWTVESADDLKLAPFHLLATEGKAHIDRDHDWHMENIRQICACDSEILLATRYQVIDVHDPASVEQGIRWWQEMTESGGEGMVVKPLTFITRGERGLIQPALKCRGREYLRIIYGPEYTTEENLTRLRARGLRKKRSLAVREFALGLEALERFVAGEPLRRVHQCCFGVLALESEPVDPRL
ncbi:polynucleotide kinase-phosphatase [Paenactinomyces guangxiensis]|uniref:Polynucleotide kinase-phosphatase n=1 Tax=Paenactinomyces guangxiensis TaxID=1490290 RepID=A0A7W1WRN0_9BACL|nr:polynucleotide kinase-phosphatase [Paenactinomyces guangxiensis]MBA4494811.1 polynucleotide kinase-phosphatase [Paenactinomyces guangxiensis]MBH8591894.1 polynucleotide kinase-phosphatase [Paenactinomyces guangxiensis]